MLENEVQTKNNPNLKSISIRLNLRLYQVFSKEKDFRNSSENEEHRVTVEIYWFF